MASSEAHRRAVAKYQREKIQNLSLKLYPGYGITKEQIQHVAEINGMSVNQWVMYIIKQHL